MDKSSVSVGNPMDPKVVQKAEKAKAGFLKKFGDDTNKVYHLGLKPIDQIPELGIENLVHSDTPLQLPENALIVGNIRMGFGHYRIAMAIASCAKALGRQPVWFDLASFDATGSKMIRHQNDLYSMGSKLSQKVGLFNKLYWEPLNSEGFRKLSYNANDQASAELMANLLKNLPKDKPYVATHVWPAQAAIHAGFTRVVNAIPDNWPMALHLAEGSVHTILTESAWLGYKALRGMDKTRSLKPMPKGDIVYTGHYIDHELVVNLPEDTALRLDRVRNGKAKRYLLTVGGAGAQQDLFASIIEHLIPYVTRNEATLFVNVGDHRDVWDGLASSVHGLSELAQTHLDDFSEVSTFAKRALDQDVSGIHAFCDADIFSAVYSSNVLMRCSDILVTKPSEFSFYPVPKLMIHRVGGHEAWGAVRAAEVGDGTYEMDETAEVLSMIDALQSDRNLISFMCDRIEQANAIGVYDGAYKVVELAVNGIA